MVEVNHISNKKLQHVKKKLVLQNEKQSQIHDECIIFANKKELYVVNEASISVYNATGGGLIEILEGHKHKIVNICQNVSEDGTPSSLVSCDEMGHIFHWYSDRSHPKHGSSVLIPLGNTDRITHFSTSKLHYIISYVMDVKKFADVIVIDKLTQKRVLVQKNMSIGQNMVAVSHDGLHLACIKETRVFVAELFKNKDKKDSNTRIHNTLSEGLTCLAFNPSKFILATGVKNGAILLWYQIMDKKPVKVKIHWHTMPVRSLCFSTIGGDMYSGGDECVLVRWHLNDGNRKSFLPRLGMPICNIQIDPTDTFVGVLHIDGSINIINAKEMRLEGMINRVVRHIPATSDAVSLPAGLHYHSPTATIIKNGRTGHLQFFNHQLLKVNCNLDITMSNYLTEERHRKLPNPEVTIATVSDDGSWLVTGEECALTSSYKEILIKFWYYSVKEQRWELNTSVQMPHFKEITSLSINSSFDNETLMLLSCSEEGKFKVWRFIAYVDSFGIERNNWNSRATREFRGLAATSSCFASDGSLFAVAFENVITLWTPDDVSIKGILTQSFIKERILDISFSYGNWEGSAVVARSAEYVFSWDLLSMSLMWRVYLQSSCLAVDRTTGLMAIFNNSKTVYFFQPQSHTPISSGKLQSAEAVCAIFAPCNEHSDRASKRKVSRKRLYYYDKQQNFFQIDTPSLNDEENSMEQPHESSLIKDVKSRNKKQKDTSDLFSALVAKTRNITHKNAERDSNDVSLIAPTTKELLKDLNEFQVQNISFFGLADHISSFLPDLSVISENSKNKPKSKISNSLSYITIDDRTQSERTFNIASIFDEEKCLEKMKKVNFLQMLNALES